MGKGVAPARRRHLRRPRRPPRGRGSRPRPPPPRRRVRARRDVGEAGHLGHGEEALGGQALGDQQRREAARLVGEFQQGARRRRRRISARSEPSRVTPCRRTSRSGGGVAAGLQPGEDALQMEFSRAMTSDNRPLGVPRSRSVSSTITRFFRAAASPPVTPVRAVRPRRPATVRKDWGRISGNAPWPGGGWNSLANTVVARSMVSMSSSERRTKARAGMTLPLLTWRTIGCTRRAARRAVAQADQLLDREVERQHLTFSRHEGAGRQSALGERRPQALNCPCPTFPDLESASRFAIMAHLA